MRTALTIIFPVLMLFILAGDASAQYFGQNKVQYRKHDFRVLQTEHFDIYFHQERREPVDVAGRLAERWYRRFSRFFGEELNGRQPIALYSSKPDFDQTLVVSGLIDNGTAGVTEPRKRRIALPFAVSLADTDHVLGHEIVHAFQFNLMASSSLGGAAGSSGEELPLWAIEGLAEYLSLGSVETHTAMWLRDAVRSNKLPTLVELSKPEYFPYRWGHAFWAYVGGRWGDAAAADVFRVAAFSGMTTAIESVLNLTEDDFVRQWHDALRAAYPKGTTNAIGTQLAGARPLGGSINVGAAISPDGRYVAYLTERIFSVDLVVADVEKGKVVATLTDTAANPRYQSLQYVGSSAAWDARGERIALSTLTDGRAALSIFKWPRSGGDRDIVIDGVDEVFNPTWAPDGKHIAFSAMSQGTTDLFIYDIEHAALRRLTDDMYADLQPAWSPDGRSIAFVTDRFTTDLTTLKAGAYRVAIIDADSGEIRPVQAFTTGKHIAPQWSRDGKTLYFIADGDGKPDVYALRLEDGSLARVTQADSGIAGLTESSPALSIAAGADSAAVGVYEGGVFAVHVLALTGAGTPAPRDGFDTPRLPPGTSGRASLVAEDDTPAPAPPEPPEVKRYSARLALEDVSQPTFSAGMDPFGGTAGGGIGMIFSDLLHTQWLVTGVQLDNPLGTGMSLRDLAGSAGYFNQGRRWQWGAFGQAIPTYVGVRTSLSGATDVFGPFVVVRQVERTARAAVSYPFSRARRIEFNGGVAQLSFDELTGFFGGGWQPAADPLLLGSAAVAFVSDTSHPGPTSIVGGERYRFEVAPVFGGLDYVNVTADYRRYFMPVPFFTLAGRALHIGRYGSGADDTRIAPLYLGYPWLVRGFNFSWNTVNNCVAVLSSGCSELNDLIGSRLAVGNLELRLPVLRPFGLKRGMYGPVPVEVAAFMDGGMAWKGATSSNAPPVYSTGLTFRANLAGFGIGQFDIAHPFSQPNAGWVFQFNLSPGF